MDFLDEERKVFFFFGILITFIAVLVVWAVTTDNKSREERIYKCEKAGGVLLDRTYQAGKTTGHNYTCVDPSIIKDMD